MNPKRLSRLFSTTESTLPKAPPKFKAFPFDYHQELNVTIEDKLTSRGRGVARVLVEDRDWVVFVPNVLPHEQVRIRVFRNFPTYSEADLLQVLEPSPERIEPPCPYANDCGGCQLQHQSMDGQRRFKTQQVQDYLDEHEVVYESVLPCMGTDETLGYRSKLTPHYNYPSKSRKGIPNVFIEAIGFQRASSRQIVDIPSCLIATPQVNAAYQAKRQDLLANALNKTKKTGATLLFRQDSIDSDTVISVHQKYMTTNVLGKAFRYRAGNFFQNNYYLLPIIVQRMQEQACQPTTSGQQLRYLADCYCGSGLFAISLAQDFDKVVGIEINDQAIEEATHNANANNITNCEFRAASAEEIFGAIDDFEALQTCCILDPPRKGCSDDFLQQLLRFGPQRIVYLSCDASTQARDAAVLQDAYRVTLVQPFDLFPQTRHIENLMVFEKKEG